MSATSKPAPAPAVHIGPYGLVNPLAVNTKAPDAVHALVSAGFALLGQGQAASAWAAPDTPDRVVKLCSSERGHIAAMRYFLDNPDSVYLPRVYGVATFADGWWAYEVERLSAVEDWLDDDDFIAIEEERGNHTAAYREMNNLRAIARDMGAVVDLMGPNFMQRSCGQMVLSDPLWVGNDCRTRSKQGSAQYVWVG